MTLGPKTRRLSFLALYSVSGVNLVRSLRDRESGRRNFRFQPKKIRFPGKISDFPGQNSDDLFCFSRQLKKLSFLSKYSPFSPFTSRFLANVSLFPIKKTQIRLYFSETRSWPPAQNLVGDRDPQPQDWRLCIRSNPTLHLLRNAFYRIKISCL